MIDRVLGQTLRWFAILLLFAVLTGCAQQIQQQQVKDNLVTALAQAQVGKTLEARAWADRAISVDPNDAKTYAPHLTSRGPDITIAQVFQAVGDDQTTVDYLKRAQAKFPNDPWILVPLSQAQARLGDTAGRKATATRLASLLEGKVHATGTVPDKTMMTLLAQAYWDAGDAAKGTETYKRLITLYPRDTEPLNGLAYAYAVANDTPHLKEALDDAKKALKLAEDKGLADEQIGAIQDTLGWVQYRMGQYNDALANLQRAASLDPREAENRYHLGMTYKALGDTDSARAELTYATLLSKGYADAGHELESLTKTPSAPQAAHAGASSPAVPG